MTIFFFLIYSFSFAFLETWSPSADENLPFPIFFQKLFPPVVMLDKKKSLKGILEKGVLFAPYIILLKLTYTRIYQKFCLDFKIIYQ